MLCQFVISPPAALGRPPILPLFSSHTPATSSANSAITAYHQPTASYLLTGRPSCVRREAFSYGDLTTFMYQQDRAIRTHPVAATSMTDCSHPFCIHTPYCCDSDRYNPSSRSRINWKYLAGDLHLFVRRSNRLYSLTRQWSCQVFRRDCISKKKKESQRRRHVWRRPMRPVRLGASAETMCVSNVTHLFQSRQDVNFTLGVVTTSSCAT